MKRLKTNVLLIMTFLSFTVFASEVSGQSCRRCDIEGGCFTCIFDFTNGFEMCHAGPACFQCTEGGEQNCGLLAARNVSTLRDRYPLGSRLSFERDLIRQIAAKQPRFAATLARLDWDGLKGNHSRVYWSPVRITQKDVKWWLTTNAESTAFFERFKAKAQQANKKITEGKASRIVYDLTLEEPSDADTATLVLRSLKGTPSDPSYSLLQINLVDVANKDARERLLVAIGWQIR